MLIKGTCNEEQANVALLRCEIDSYQLSVLIMELLKKHKDKKKYEIYTWGCSMMNLHEVQLMLEQPMNRHWSY